jgi:hypothetical protein
MHVHRLARVEFGRRRRVEHGFNHEDELVSHFLAIDDGRRVFGAGRDITNLADEKIRHAIHRDPHLVAVMDRTDARFRNERADLDILRWQEREYRFTRCDPFTLAIERVVNQSGLCCRLPLLHKTPVRLGKPPLILVSR